ncbi:MAG TPA: hypothetical protein PLD59_04810 [Tepidisphaeraceae bacterium]|nr:hypothetical protein [Tepidisphaeraceae bacterium]
MKPRLKTLIVIAVAGMFAPLAVAAPIFVDFGEAAQPTGNNYNNVSQAQLPIFNAIDTTGAGTGIGITTSGFNPGSNQNGTTSPTGAATIFDSQATRDNLFGHTVNFNQPAPLPLGVITITGLTPGTPYDFAFFGSRTGVTDNRETQFAASGANSVTALLDTANNVSNIGIAAGVLPNGSGTIQIAVSPGPNNTNGSGFFYVAAMRMEAIPEPGSVALALLPLGIAALRRRRLR